MTSKARQKIDPQTKDMFDPEVERPDHDKILTTLFSNDDALLSLLADLHQPAPLKPFTPESRFRVAHFGYGARTTVIDLAEAVSKTGVTPSWVSDSPIRIVGKQLEVPMLWYSEHQRSSRIMGFCDIAVRYQIVEWPSICVTEKGAYHWEHNAELHYALIEVKAVWPTVGNLIRQLNLYRHSSPLGHQGKESLIVVGPDVSMNEVACQHHYRLATFDSSGTKFTLQQRISAPSRSKNTEGQF